ncbi:MAG: disulfide bond formation protein DsbA [Solirubrobacterales bacterium]|nr:disulfide bond formation protein DsbA [Solirubrobacterales bacterium]
MAENSLHSSPVPPLGSEDHVRGEGPLVLFYADFSCPRCALAWERLDAARVRVAFRHLALKAKHPRAVALACAAEAAGRQDRFWDFAAALYTDQGRTEDPHLWAHCERLGLDVERWERDRRAPEAAERVTRDVRAALRAGAVATPTLFHGAAMLAGPPDAAWIAALSDEAVG